MNSPKHNLDDGFFVAGVNYRTAPVHVRERMAVAHPDRIEVSRLLQLKAGLSEVVVLWTCNRVEIYGVSARGQQIDVGPMFECLAREMSCLAPHVYCHRGQDALKHLFKVASGLDSMVMGETQITGQVRDSYEAARAAKLAGKVLNSVFQKALRTAKMVRTSTSIGRGARSVGGVAVAHAREALGERGLSKHTVLMVGAGEMASCCLLHLQKKGECNVVVANRSLDRAEALAAEFNGTAVPFNQMFDAMVEADVVISSTGSPQTVINRSDLEPVMQARASRPLMIIDIAVPRDVEPEVADIEGVHLHDIDALESTVQQTLGRWEKDLEMCEAIIEQEIESLVLQFKSRRAAGNSCHDAAPAAVAV
ncbi:MAG: glutamyl-tRNA reductase [Kiritimatiellales bacterium]|nr:glutamyl-tRNA reductase [Kiritimatiellales bacterium]MCF7863625.1 glutamyl-tRNA reductase [Kiritimatiellales bacterium]